MATAELGIPVIPVQSEGFKGTKKDGYSAACPGPGPAHRHRAHRGHRSSFREHPGRLQTSPGEIWVIRAYLERMGVEVVATMTGDGRVDTIRLAHGAKLNIVQCAGSMTSVAKLMKEKYGIPYVQVSFFGLEDCADALYQIAKHFGDPEMLRRTKEIVKAETEAVLPELARIRKDLEGKKAALYVGGAFKAFSW